MRSALAAQANDIDDGGQCRLLGLDFAKHPAIIENIGVRPPAVEFDVPFACRSAPELQTIAGSSPLKLNMLVFKAGFAKNDNTIEVKTLSKAEGLRQKILQFFGPDLAELILEEEVLMTEFYVWARKRGAVVVNVEPNGMGSIKCIVSERASISIAMAPLSRLQAGIGKVIGPNGSAQVLPDLARVRRFLMAEVSQDIIDSWAASGDVTLHHMTLEEGDVLCTPPGWVVVERTVSSAALGAFVSWLRATAAAHANLAAMHCMLDRLGQLNAKAVSVRDFLQRAVEKISATAQVAPAAPSPEAAKVPDAPLESDSVDPSAAPPTHGGSPANKQGQEVARADEAEAGMEVGAATIGEVAAGGCDGDE